MMLKGQNVYLRALEPEDLDFIFNLENDVTFWEISQTQVPYSRYILEDYLKNSHKDIYEVKQLRLAICDNKDLTIGLIDVFDFDPKNNRAGLGIIIRDEFDRNKGYGDGALKLLIYYCFTHLNLHQLYCNVTEDNQQSLKLFKKNGFETIGLKKDWNYYMGAYKSEYLLQLVNTK